MDVSGLDELFGDIDWNKTALGPSTFWPPSLKSMALQITRTLLPMCILWGEDRVQLSNRPFRTQFSGSDILKAGKSLYTLPEPFWQAIVAHLQPAELGNPVITPDIEYDREQFESPGSCFFSVSIAPLVQEPALITGLLLTFIDTTEKVRSQRLVKAYMDVKAPLTPRQRVLNGEQHSQMLLNSLPTIAWSNDTNGEVNFYNQRWYDYTGLTFDETKAWGWKVVIHPDDLQYNLEAYSEILAGDSAGSFEIREKGTDGAYRWHLVNLEPVRDNIGKTIQWIGTATDIHRLKELEQQKDEFISIASHELKTPLTSIKAFNQIMQRTQDCSTLKDFVVRSSNHIVRLEKLMNDLLDVSRISSGKLIYDMQEFAFDKILTESIESIQMTTEKHQIIYNGCDDVPFHGDPNRLEQVLNNLLNNAIKYSPDGGTITVTCTVDNAALLVSVADQGIGIEKHHLNNLFDRYYRIDNTAMRFSGLGLGLYITSEIIKRHKGSLWIESELGEGSTFYFRLPMADHSATIEVDEEGIYRDQWISMYYSQADNWVECQWTGYQNIYSIKRSCLRLLKMCGTHKVSNLLADNTYVKGTWTDATDWVAKEFYPMMDNAGIRKLAWVHSKSTFSQLAAEKTVDLAIGGVTTRFFDSVEIAKSWLHQE